MDSITDKTYKKLTLLVNEKGFSYAITDTLSSKVYSVNQIQFSNSETNSTEDKYKVAFETQTDLQQKFDSVQVLHNNNLATFVPTAFFDENNLSSYLQFNVKVFETDFFAFDENPNHQMNTVFVPFVNINNQLIDIFGSFDYKHSFSVLVPKLLTISKNIDDKKMYVHVQDLHFEIIVVQNQKLLLFNSFEYKTPEDLLYYILFTAEQLLLNPENFLLEFLGNIDQESPFFTKTFEYVRNVSLMPISEQMQLNGLSEIENRNHFTLLNL